MCTVGGVIVHWLVVVVVVVAARLWDSIHNGNSGNWGSIMNSQAKTDQKIMRRTARHRLFPSNPMSNNSCCNACKHAR